MEFQITSMHVTSAVQKQLGVFSKCHFMSATPLLCNLRCIQRMVNALLQHTYSSTSSSRGSVLSLCVNDPFAKNFIYSYVPRYYTWNQSNQQWDRRKRRNTTETPGIFQTSMWDGYTQKVQSKGNAYV